jgi:hypothetical protein
MIKKITGETWKQLTFTGWKQLRNRYAISSHGRIASFKKDITEDGKVLSGSLTTGYRTLNLHRPGSKGTLYIHREMAKLFLPKPGAGQKYVVHRNHNKLDNSIKNLRSKNRSVTIKQLAEKFGVSEMTMYRIKSGENWAKIK